MGSWKGSTEIILTDTKTKEEKRVKSDNVFKANNIAKFCQSYWGIPVNPTLKWCKKQNKKLWITLVGGLFIFDKNIPEDSYMMPPGTTMVGNGSYNISNNSDITELGSYNESESEVTDNSVKIVYDFTTSQANGEIGCICLTSDFGGLIGMGNTSLKKYTDNTRYALDYRDTDGNSYLPGEYNSSYGKLPSQTMIDSDGMAYQYYRYNSIDFTNNTLTLYKKRLSIKNIDILNKPYYNHDQTIYYDDTLIIPFEGETSTSYRGNDNTAYCDNGHVYAIRYIPSYSNYGIAPNGKFLLYIFDVFSGTYTKNEYTNIISNETYISPESISVIGEGKFLVVSYNSYKVYYMDTNNNEVIEFNNINRGISKMPFRECEGFFISFGSQNQVSYIFDPVNKTLKSLNLVGENSNENYCRPGYMYNSYLKAFTARSIAPNPLYLATINNLSEPVYKTDSQTMKVIYTLTRQQS